MSDIRHSQTLTEEQLDALIVRIRDDRIILRPEAKKKAIVQDIVIPENVQEDQFEVSPFLVGRVVRCGPGMGCADPDKRHQMDVSPGERIVHHKAAGDELFLNGERFLVIGNRDVLMVITDDAELVQVVGKMRTQLALPS